MPRVIGKLGDVTRPPPDGSVSDDLVRRLIARRVDLKLTQTDVAIRLGWSQCRVSRFESAVVDKVDVDALAAYAEAVGLTLSVWLTRKQKG